MARFDGGRSLDLKVHGTSSFSGTAAQGLPSWNFLCGSCVFALSFHTVCRCWSVLLRCRGAAVPCSKRTFTCKHHALDSQRSAHVCVASFLVHHGLTVAPAPGVESSAFNMTRLRTCVQASAAQMRYLLLDTSLILLAVILESTIWLFLRLSLIHI